MTTIFQNDLPDELEIKGDIAIDTEAMGLNIKRDRLCLLQLSNGDGKAYLVHFATPNYQAPNLRRLLSQDQQKIFHFARFDLTMIKNYLGIDMTNIFCTKIASIMARTYSSSHSLKEVCRELLGINLAKQACQSYWGGQVLSEEQLSYAAQDVIYLHRLRDILQDQLIRENRMSLAQLALNFLPSRVALDLAGWPEDIFAHC